MPQLEYPASIERFKHMKCSECYWHEQCGGDTCVALCSDYTPLAEMSARDIEEYNAQLQDRYEIYEITVSSLK